MEIPLVIDRKHFHADNLCNWQVNSAPNRLEALKGKRKGQYNIRINDQWRICFVWADGNANKVEIVDYH